MALSAGPLCTSGPKKVRRCCVNAYKLTGLFGILYVCRLQCFCRKFDLSLGTFTFSEDLKLCLGHYKGMSSQNPNLRFSSTYWCIRLFRQQRYDKRDNCSRQCHMIVFKCVLFDTPAPGFSLQHRVNPSVGSSKPSAQPPGCHPPSQVLLCCQNKLWEARGEWELVGGE